MRALNLILISFLFVISKSQDVIVLQFGDSISSKVVEITRHDIRYKKINFPEGPVYSIKKSKVVEIKHHNGETGRFNTPWNKKRYIQSFYITTGVDFGTCNKSYSGHELRTIPFFFGLGYQGEYPVPIKGLSVLYGVSEQIAMLNFREEPQPLFKKENYYLTTLYTGVQYQYPLRKNHFGLFTSLQLGMLLQSYNDSYPNGHSTYATKFAVLGIYSKRSRWAARFALGDFSDDILKDTYYVTSVNLAYFFQF